MSALREWAASVSQEAHRAAAVSRWGKWKTTTQVLLTSDFEGPNTLILGPSTSHMKVLGAQQRASWFADGGTHLAAVQQPGRRWSLVGSFGCSRHATALRGDFPNRFLALRIHASSLEVPVLRACSRKVVE